MDLFDLYCKIAIDDSSFISGVEESKGMIAQASTFMNAKSVAIGNAMYDMGKKAVNAFVDLGKSAIENYGEYEQLVGGVDTLFKQASDVVQQYAANAYKTAGMSANEYMETVTSFSASLLQSLDGDTAAAAEKADLAITDMADNANKMGTSMESIQNAYQGFAKQNYTMLDNLKLGYGGTKEEMARLIEDAAKLKGLYGADAALYANKGVNGDLSIIVDAIHTVQNEMGITGTTAQEASSTIQGSVSSMKSAWTNLVTGMATDNADIDLLLDNLLKSVDTVATNILPVVERILSNIFDTLAERGPDMLSAAIKLFMQIASGALKTLPDIIASVPQIIEAIVNGFMDGLPYIIDVGKQIIEGLWEGIKSMGSWLGDKVSGFFDDMVDGVKDFLGIHSPSRVFAGIGENMALGLGEGWDDEYGRISRNIKAGMNFGTASVDFASSGLGMSSAGIVNGISGAASSHGGNFTVNFVLPDGMQLSSYIFDDLTKFAAANGTPILNRQMQIL